MTIGRSIFPDSIPMHSITSPTRICASRRIAIVVNNYSNPKKSSHITACLAVDKMTSGNPFGQNMRLVLCTCL